jgi:hypothetical protein
MAMAMTKLTMITECAEPWNKRRRGCGRAEETVQICSALNRIRGSQTADGHDISIQSISKVYHLSNQ